MVGMICEQGIAFERPPARPAKEKEDDPHPPTFMRWGPLPGPGFEHWQEVMYWVHAKCKRGNEEVGLQRSTNYANYVKEGAVKDGVARLEDGVREKPVLGPDNTMQDPGTAKKEESGKVFLEALKMVQDEAKGERKQFMAWRRSSKNSSCNSSSG